MVNINRDYIEYDEDGKETGYRNMDADDNIAFGCHISDPKTKVTDKVIVSAYDKEEALAIVCRKFEIPASCVKIVDLKFVDGVARL